jgi:putative peptide zinc metalloprotease protein
VTQVADTYAREARVSVYPFSRQEQAEDIVIGRVDTGVFLSLPAEAVALLDELGAGKTIGEVQDAYFAAHGEIPDMEGLLGYLEERGFVSVLAPGAAAPDAAAFAAGPGQDGGQPARQMRYHFTNIPAGFAAKLFGKPALAIYAAVTAAAIFAAATHPAILPGPRALFFDEHITFFALALLVWGYSSIFFHEMGHLLAARAAGVDSRLGIGHRLWVLVAETDLTNLWSRPKRERYLPFLAGAIVDLVSGSLVVLLLAANQEGWIALSAVAERLARAIVFVYFLRLVWQCFFFVRTDFYYVLSTWFGCVNLLGDTETFLRNQVARFTRLMKPRDQSMIPASEWRVIHMYSVIWALGRILALATLFTVTLPLLLLYSGMLIDALRVGYGADPLHFLDVMLISTFTLVPLVAGLGLWAMSLFKGWRRLA